MFLRVLMTECLKLKRTLALWMVLVAPLVMVMIQFAVSYKNAPRFLHEGKDAWAPMVRQTVEAWTLLFMPLLVTLETALLAGLENSGKNWKSLLALPAPRWTVYLSKLVVTIGMLWMAHVVLVSATAASAQLLKLIHPALNLGQMPLSPFVIPMLRVSISALFAVAIQHWVSLRWHSYTAAMGFGMCVMMIGVFASQSQLIGPWFPWSLPIHAVMSGVAGMERITLLAVFGALVTASLGCWEFTRREIA